MARYIDAEVLKQALSHFGNEDAIYRDEIEMYIDDTPTADVVKAVRCKDCRSWDKCGVDVITNYEYGFCRQYQWQDEDGSRETNGQDFCSYGAKMDGKDGEGK